jgi:hypothetical protein
MYVFFSSTDEDGVRTMMLADIDDLHIFAQKFLAFAPGARPVADPGGVRGCK